MVLTCNDFIRSGFFKEEDCCSGCHENDYCLLTESWVVQHPTNKDVKAVLCCIIASNVNTFTRKMWDEVVDRKAMGEK